MSIKDSITYQFRSAAWKAANFIENPDDDKNGRNLLISAALVGVLSGGGFIVGKNETPDDNIIDGQDQLIENYEKQILSLKSVQNKNLETLRKEWRYSEADKKNEVMVQMDIVKQDFSEQAFNLLAGIHTENKISEKEIGKILENFESKIGDVESISFNGKSFLNIGDAANLNEAQADYMMIGDEKNRALNIAKKANALEKKKDKILNYLS